MEQGQMTKEKIMAQIYTVHPQDPQQRTIDAIRADLLNGAVMLYPTDTVYAIGCDINAKAAVQRVRQIKQMSNDKPLTFLCSSLSNIAQYARVSDPAYRIMRKLIPGPYTFCYRPPSSSLNWSKIPSENHWHSSAGSSSLPIPIGLPSHSDYLYICAFLRSGKCSRLVKKQEPLSPAELFDHFDKQVDLIIENGQDLSTKVSTILDLCQDQPAVVREGLGWDTLSSEFAWV